MLKKIDESRTKALDLLAAAMPKIVANKLLMGSEANMSEMFEDVTILSSKVLKFNM